MIELTKDQRRQTVVLELSENLIFNKQYLSNESKNLFLQVLKSYATLIEWGNFVERFNRAWPNSEHISSDGMIAP